MRSNLAQSPLALNGTQKAVIENVVNLYLDELKNFQDKTPVLTPRQAIAALKIMLEDRHLTREEEVFFSHLKVLEHINFIRRIVSHPYPQNRASSYTNVGQEEGWSMFHLPADRFNSLFHREATLNEYGEVSKRCGLIFKNGRRIAHYQIIRLFINDNHPNNNDFVGKEPKGVLSLTNIEDADTPFVTKQAVVDYIRQLVTLAIHEIEVKASVKSATFRPAANSRESYALFEDNPLSAGPRPRG